MKVLLAGYMVHLATRLPGKPLADDMPDGPVRELDILFIASEHLDRLTPERLQGPADLVIEIVSDESVTRDRADKLYEYEEAGVRECWIIDPRPRRHRAEFYVRDERACTTQLSCRASGYGWTGYGPSSGGPVRLKNLHL